MNILSLYKTLHAFLKTLSLFVIFLFISVGSTLAQDSALHSAADIKHAENQAAASALDQQAKVQIALEVLNAANKALGTAQASGDPKAIARAKAFLAQAVSNAENLIASAGSVTGKDVSLMLSVGMDLEDIAENLGLHEGTAKDDQAEKAITARNLQSDQITVHGFGPAGDMSAAVGLGSATAGSAGGGPAGPSGSASGDDDDDDDDDDDSD